ncbi:hypothetical protein L249_4852 [Ophiocordyceps polyrhachis-furcata BCC 54312]|uniref:Secretory lipase n=1 Tax=Ophiocordyceps polyrhachis-furcata BCC 54312 TaxID=1330021 RepID=A0A367L2M4_9HYPO|nr:hypothetical protein L249_4852 [Ophiocordyceps polyrhachis-furcata BCC 54312]
MIRSALLPWAAYMAMATASALTPPLSVRRLYDTNAVSLPTHDPFYLVPNDVATVTPGTILKRRKPSSPLVTAGEDEYAEHVHQILYRTTDEDGSATATVLTVLIPKNADRNKVVSFQSASHAVTIDCAASFTFFNASMSYPDLISPSSQTQLLFAEGALSRGWIVLVPDYNGPQSTPFNTKLMEQSILDGIRAGINSRLFNDNATIALWGYSGGGTATLRAVQAQPSYAPELQLAGAAIGGAPMLDPDLVRSLFANKTPFAGFIPILILGYAATRPWLRRLMDANLKPEYRQRFYLAQHQCMDQVLRTLQDVDILSWFKDPTFLLSVPSPSDRSATRKIPAAIPIYWYRLATDPLLALEGIDRRLEAFCSDGARITQVMETADGATHRSFGILGAPGALRWLEGILDDRSRPAGGCSNTEAQTTELDPGFLRLFSNETQLKLLDVLAHDFI